MRKLLFVLAAGLFVLCRVQPAQAQWAVIDVDAIAQLMNQIKQMQQEYQSISGSRGMQTLLGGVNRNYLPAQWTQIPTALSSQIRTYISANAVLTPAQVAALSSADQQVLTALRQNAALLQAASQESYANASSRFAALQQLIDAIASATDQKGSLELQARIQAENAMLQNDATKLSVLYQAAQAQDWSNRQRMLEQAMADVGSLRSLPALRLP